MAVDRSEGPPAGGGASGSSLKKNAISPLGLAALAIGLTSPAIGLFALWGTMQTATGPITPLIFLAAMLFTLPTGLSYAVLNTRFPSAGAASTWLWRAISPGVGFLAGLLMLTYFLMATIACPLMFAMFFGDLAEMIHAPLSRSAALYIGVFVATVPVAACCLRGAEASTKVTVRLMLAETLVVMALSVTILIAKWGHLSEVALAPFNPGNATQGFSGFWAAMIVGVLGFCGFDVVSTAAEEANAPRTQVPRAIFITLVGMGLFWAANAWVYTFAISQTSVDAYTQAGISAVNGIAKTYWGWGSLMVVLTAFTGMTAVYISCAQGASRIAFALARHRLLPPSLGVLAGSRRVPRNAVWSVLGCAVVFWLATLYVLRNGLDSFNWWSFALVFFATLTFMAVNVANAVYFFRFARKEFNIFKNLLVPVAGFAINAYLLYAAFFSSLWSSNLPTGRSVVVGSVAILIAELAVVASVRTFAPQLFDHGAPVGVDGQ
jgi:amino acid transporter